MKSAIHAAAVLIGALTMAQANSAGAAMDALTQLPLPNSAGALQIGSDPMAVPNVPVCKSKAQMNFYTPNSGKVDAAIAWYSANLKGFKLTHGYGSGRSQDTFYNSAGTLIVSITGHPAAAGQNTDVYSIIYGTIQPGVSEKVIVGMNLQKVNCS
jgi:hypothetical protein